MNFLKNNPSSGTPNRIVIEEVTNQGSPVRLYFHPFITEFSHNITPAFSEDKYGILQINVPKRVGVSEQSYSIGFVLPAIDEDHARRNYSRVQRLKRLVTPTIDELVSRTGRVKMSVGKLTARRQGSKTFHTRYGYITAFNETFDFDAGFSSGYPKIINISFTLVIDETYEELLKEQSSKGDKKSKDRKGKAKAGSDNKSPTDAKAKNQGEAAARKMQEKSLK